MRLLVPAYFYPQGPGLAAWDKLIEAAADGAPITAIVNPASGPGNRADTHYTRIVLRAATAGLPLIGYVSTRYGERPLAEVTADVDRWRTLYPAVRGIFFDEQASAGEKVDYYTALYAHARRNRARALIVNNPGVVCAPDYFSRPAGDAFCVFENKTGFEGFRLSAWAARYAPDRFVALAYQVSRVDRMRAYVRKAARERIGYVYVTDDGGDNPWDRLPRYWAEEMKYVREVNRRLA